MQTTEIVVLFGAYTIVLVLCWLSSIFTLHLRRTGRTGAFCIFVNVFFTACAVVVGAIAIYAVAEALNASNESYRGEQTMAMFSGERVLLAMLMWLAAVGATAVIANIVTAVKLARMSEAPSPTAKTP